MVASVAYSLRKKGNINFYELKGEEKKEEKANFQVRSVKVWMNYYVRIPFRYLISGEFFHKLFSSGGSIEKDMVFRMLFLFFACFICIFMPYLSKDYGVTGDEFVDHRHAGYVFDYFAKGDKAALDQPKTVLHLYGNCVQVITGALCRWFDVDNYYELRHFVGGFVGALGILFTGLIGLRWGGGLGGCITLLLMFFTPRFFGHSMNNLKDVPFAVGYVIALYYTIRLFDYYPRYKTGAVVGLILGIALAMGTRSGGLILYPMLLMYAGLYYIQRYGIKEFYKFRKYRKVLGNILVVLSIVVVGSYVLSILLWPFALQKPLGNVFYSLEKFTNYSIGLRTIFDGEQMMSNMLPWKYAPKYLCITMPVVTLVGFFGYFLYLLIRRREFSLIGFFLLFAAVFPVFWVIYKNSNLYGGIRHLLFVMPPLVVVAGHFWERVLGGGKKYVQIGGIVIFVGLMTLPISHYIRNHPNEYVYFNEIVGGLRGTYGNYETDYYFNSLKESCDWFKKNIPLPAGGKITIVTQHPDIVKYYFRKEPNVQVIYSRYYEKYSKDWDYGIFGNCYINRFQLQNHLFPPKEVLYTPTVDGLPMSAVVKRKTKMDLKGFELEREKMIPEAIVAFEEYTKNFEASEEVWARMGKLYYMMRQWEKADSCLRNARKLHPSLMEALYVSVLLHVQQKNYREALTDAARILAENSSSVDGYYLRALARFKLKQYNEAIADINKIMGYRPDYQQAIYLAADIMKTNNNYSRAIDIYKKIPEEKRDINTWVEIADCYVRQKDYRQAENILDQMEQKSPEYFPLYKVRTRLFLMQGRFSEAADLLVRMNTIDKDAELFILRALYLNSMKRQEQALRMLGEALKLDDENSEALQLQKAWK